MKPTAWSVLPAVFLIGTPGTSAQDALQALEPLIVTATRVEEGLWQIPYTAAVLDSTVFSQSLERTVPEALGAIPNVMVQKTSRGHGSPYIRGFTGRQNLFLIDGIRLNNATWRSGPVQYANSIDPYAVDRIEVVKGHGSVLYGSDAIGGTVNIITKVSGFRDEPEGGFFNHGEAFYRFDSNSRSHVGRLESRLGQGGRFGVLLGVSAKDFGDIRDSALGRMRNTGYDERNFDLKFEYALAADVTLTLAHQTLDQDDVWRWHSTVFNPGWTAAGGTAPGTFLRRTYDQGRTLTYARIDGESPGAAVERWSATLSRQRQDESETQVRTLADRRFQSMDVTSYGLAFQLESEVGPGTAVYGGDFYRDEVDSYGERNGVFRADSRPVADDSRYETIGLFGQYRWQPVEPLTVTLGSRVTRSEARLGRFFDTATMTDLSARRSWNSMVSAIRGTYRLDPYWSVYGGISQGFRAPNLDDLSGNLTARSGLTALGSMDVEPEKFLNHELGIRRGNNRLQAGAAVFYTSIRDVVTPVPVAPGSATTVTTNGQDGYVYGIEVDGSWQITPEWTLSGFASWQDGKAETPDFIGGPVAEEPLSRLMPLTARAALRWSHPNGRLWAEARVTASARADRLSAGDRRDTQRIPPEGTPGYAVVGLHGGWQARPDLLLTLGMENLTDRDYRIHGSGQNEPGFNVITGIKWTW